MDLSFSGAGFMGTYYIGVLDCWNRLVPRERVNRLAGASAGSLTAAYWLQDEPLSKCLHEIMALISSVRERPLGVFDRSHQIVDLLPKLLDTILPADAHKRASGRLFVAMTRLAGMKRVIQSEFETRDDLIEALNCSCFIPVWSGNKCATFRGEKHIDGGFSDNLPVFDEHTIRVCCFAGGSEISPYDRSRIEMLNAKVRNMPIVFNFANVRRIGKALFPPSPSYILSLLKSGFHETREFLLDNDIIQCESCYKSTAPEERPIFSLDAPMITPSASPAVSRASSFREQPVTKVVVKDGKLSVRAASEKKRHTAQAKPWRHEPIESKTGERRSFAALLRHKLASSAILAPKCKRHTSKSHSVSGKQIKTPKLAVTDFCDDRRHRLSHQLPTISATDFDHDNNNNKLEARAADESVEQRLSFEGEKLLALSEAVKKKLSKEEEATSGNSLAPGERFSLAPNSCPPSPSIGRHCVECLRLRQAARMVELDEELVQTALKFDAMQQARRDKSRLRPTRTLSAPVRWLRARATAARSYSLQTVGIRTLAAP